MKCCAGCEWLPTGYHGTLKSNVEGILKEGKFHHSRKSYEWLGFGVYFFKHEAFAAWWADMQVNNKLKNTGEKDSSAVLCADLFFSKNQLLDLDDPDQLDALNEFIDDYIKKTPKYSKIWNTSKEKERWCLACNLYRRINKDIKVICLTFRTSAPRNRKNTGSFPKSQFQYCISDDSIINNIRQEVI